MTTGLKGIRLLVLAASIGWIGSALAADPLPASGARGDGIDRIAYVDAKKLLPSLHRHVIGEEAVLELGTQTIGKLMTDFRIDLVVQQLIYWSARIDMTKEVAAVLDESGPTGATFAAGLDRAPRLGFVNSTELVAGLKKTDMSNWVPGKSAVELVSRVAEELNLDGVFFEAVYCNPRIDITREAIKAWSGKFSREPSMERFVKPPRIRFVNPADVLKVGTEKGWSQDKTLKLADAVMTKMAEKEQIDLILQEVVTRNPQADITERVVELLRNR